MRVVMLGSAWFSDLWSWLVAHEHVFWWLGLLSIGTLLVSALVVPAVLIRLPADYFLTEARPPRRTGPTAPARPAP